MISAKKIREGQRKIEIMGNNLEILEDLISETKPTMATIKLPCSLDDLKKFGGENT